MAMTDRLYAVWRAMHQRCENPRDKDYAAYGGRGVSVCEAWRDLAEFARWAGDVVPGLTLERLDNSGSYSPENCSWVTRRQQALNRRSSRMLTAFGETKTLIEWTEDARCAVGRTTLSSRIHKMGWDHETAITRVAA